MAALDISRPAVAPANGSVFARILARFTVWNEARKTRSALAVLSDRELQDIGLERADIHKISIMH